MVKEMKIVMVDLNKVSVRRRHWFEKRQKEMLKLDGQEHHLFCISASVLA